MKAITHLFKCRAVMMRCLYHISSSPGGINNGESCPMTGDQVSIRQRMVPAETKQMETLCAAARRELAYDRFRPALVRLPEKPSLRSILTRELRGFLAPPKSKSVVNVAMT